MANQETAYGLRPIGLVGSAVNSTGLTQYEIASNNTNAIAAEDHRYRRC
jgi:hypothetical protein